MELTKFFFMKFDTLKEAYTYALEKAEGYQSDMRIPVFKNEDETFETGGIQHHQWSDISDGSFEEIGSVKGWMFDDEDNGVSKNEQLNQLLSDGDWIEEQDQLFFRKIRLGLMQKKYSNIITSFLRSHPAISATAIEEELKLPDSTIRQALTGPRLIPAKHIFPLICLLAGYGLEIDGYTLSYDPSDGLLTGRKWAENIKTKKEGQGFAYIVKEYRLLAASYFDLIRIIFKQKTYIMKTIRCKGAKLHGYSVEKTDGLSNSQDVMRQDAAIIEGVHFNHHAVIDMTSGEIFKPNDGDWNWIIGTTRGYNITSTPVFYSNGIDIKLCRFNVTKYIHKTEDDKDFIIKDLSYTDIVEFINKEKKTPG